ncbi:MAG: hypothetical protein MUC51_14010 [Anaerolineae bacterium]|nr:hypothetical protein [Anaerolineae bacterium]
MSNHLVSLLTALLITAELLVSCVPVPMEDLAAQQMPVAAATTAPTLAPTASATASATASPKAASTATALAPTSAARALPTATNKPSDTPAAISTATPRPTARATDMPPTSTIAPTTTTAPLAAPARAAEADPQLIVITEADIAQAVAQGAGAQQGVTIENLKVRFADGKMNITAGKVGYGLIKLQNLNLVGRLVARDGALSIEVDSITPRGLAANFIPTMANQALATYAADWYVEDVQIRDGRVELRIR